VGAVVVPIYSTLTQDQVEHLLAGFRFASGVVSTQAQLSKVLGFRLTRGWSEL